MLSKLFEFQASPPEEVKEEEEKKKKEVGKKTKVLVTLTAHALMLLTVLVAYFYFAETYGATVTILGVAVWAVVFHLLRSRNLIDEVIENVIIVAIVGVMVIITILNWNVMETPFREIMVAGGILIVAISLRDLQKFWREYGSIKITATSVINENNFKFFKKI